jgi:hypothetical protein
LAPLAWVAWEQALPPQASALPALQQLALHLLLLASTRLAPLASLPLVALLLMALAPPPSR